MASPEHVQMVATFGIGFLIAGVLELLTGTALDRSGLVRLSEHPTTFKIAVACHLLLGVFCYGGQFFVQTH
jgi:hypothetical protein